jgi:DNA-binding transcriptional regulator LsrR (DeoR family)
MKTFDMNKSYASPIDVRSLTPIWANTAEDYDVVARCAEAFAKSFAHNPAEPRVSHIAKAAKCGRNDVKEYLAKASRRGMLVLSLRLPKQGQLSHALARKYNLAEAIVTLNPADWSDQDSIRSCLAVELMNYFERFCFRLTEQEGERCPIRIGIDGGQTLHQAVWEADLSALPRVKYELVPLVWGPLVGSKFTASIVANILGMKLEALGAEVEVTDGFAFKASAHDSFDEKAPMQFTIEKTCAAAQLPMQLLLVGIGSGQAGLLHRELQSVAKSKKPVKHFGDILNLPFDREGKQNESIAHSRAVLLSLFDLQRLSKSRSTLVVAAAGGEDKIEAIRTVLRCGYISVFITDPTTAMHLLK